MDKKLSKRQCAFRKGYSAQHCLLVMLEKWRATVDKGPLGPGEALPYVVCIGMIAPSGWVQSL